MAEAIQHRATEGEGEQGRRLHADLASLRIERGMAPVRRPRRPRRGRMLLAAIVVAVLALAALFGLRGRAQTVVVATATRTLPGGEEAPALLSGSGYIVTGDRY